MHSRRAGHQVTRPSWQKSKCLQTFQLPSVVILIEAHIYWHFLATFSKLQIIIILLQII